MVGEFLTGSGEVIDGIYRLGAAIQHSADCAVFETEFGSGALPALIRICRCAPDLAPELAAQWSAARELSHPNLQKVYAAGSSELTGVPVVYIVTERPDESLEGVLEERALTASEVREMLVPVLAALNYLHKKGYAHSRIAPSTVLAVGDQVKLSSDSAGRVLSKASVAEDMRALGVLIVRAFTLRSPDFIGGSDADVMGQLPQPFADIARHCLDSNPRTRWTAAQVDAKLNAPEVLAEGPHLPKWVYASVAALVLVLILMSVVRRKNSEPERAVATFPVSVAPQPIPERAAVPEATPPVRAVGRRQGGWWVIAAAYNSREAAEKRMHSMMQRWPGFHVAVSQPQSDRAHYYVTLGENLAEDQAEALRKRAVESGLPRDTYIKRVM